MRAMINRVREELRAQVWQDTFIIDLLSHEGECRGALVWNAEHGKTYVWAKQTILCTGGCGQVYRESTNPPVATGDGHAVAYRAGAVLRDMEFMQFHPTVLYIAGSGRSLITEAVRGEGAELVDNHGHRFMPDYDERAELAPRDVVSRSIVEQMDKTMHPCVYLQMSHLDAEATRQRFPASREPAVSSVSTSPATRSPSDRVRTTCSAAIKVDHDGRTSLPRLWAAGEATSTGLHGANRLASNSLLEGLVYGARAGAGAATAALDEPDSFHAIPLENPIVEPDGPALDLPDIRNSLKSLMWRSAGVWRDRERLTDAAHSIDAWLGYVLNRQLNTPDAWELQNMLTLARLMIDAAVAREESRGVHLRTDFAEPDDNWRCHVVLERESAARRENRGQ